MDEALLISLRYEASAACPRPMADCDTTGLAPWSVHKEAFQGEEKHRRQALAHFTLGKVHENQKRFQEALENYLTSERIYNKILSQQQIDDVSELYIALAMLSVELKDDALANKYFKLHLQTFGLDHVRTQKLMQHFYAHGLTLPL